MKKLLSLLLLVPTMLFFASCGGDDDDDDAGTDPDPATPTLETISGGELTADATWEGGNIFVLDGRVVVPDGVTLTIEAGTVVKGESGEGANASALIIARGGKIMAQGTATEPIIFTTIEDQIEPGQTESPNLDQNDNGKWGGLIILGNAPISADDVAVQIEGIPADDTNGLYGGTNASDNSGTITYISIRHGGANIGEGNEINGLTLGGVGSGTTINHIEIVANADDGIEFFGGTVNVSNALVWAQRDDAFDIDQAWSGTLDNFVYIAGEESDHGLEIDGPEGSGTGSFILRNGTLKGLNAEMADFRDGATGTVTNSYFYNFSNAGDFELDADGSDDPADATTALSDNPGNSDNYASGAIILTGNQFNSTITDSSDPTTLEVIFSDKWKVGPTAFDPSDARSDAQAVAQAEANKAKFVADNELVTAGTVGADTEVFGWTFASASAVLDF